jgi:(p)ppGpp synthase/HD superfamily hydrolase
MRATDEVGATHEWGKQSRNTETLDRHAPFHSARDDGKQEKHKNQKYGSEPYSVHLEAVVENLKQHGVYDEEVIAAAWLHDSIEDQDVTYEDIDRAFGRRVADLVHAVTTPKDIPLTRGKIEDSLRPNCSNAWG